MAACGVDEGEARLQLSKALLRRKRQHPTHKADIVLLGLSERCLVLLLVHAPMIGASLQRA
jgi:hypothetical protein